MSERPYVPSYKPYGMTDEEFDFEVKQAEQRVSEWEEEQRLQKFMKENGLGEQDIINDNKPA